MRGTWQGKPVRKCVQCGAGMTVGFPKRISLIEQGLWARMEASRARESGSDSDDEDEADLLDEVGDDQEPDGSGQR